MIKFSAKEISAYGILTGFALTMHLVENLFLVGWGPPGARLGLANIVTLMLLVSAGFRPALIVTVLRVIMGSFFGGTFLAMGFWMSISGGIGSTVLMGLIMLLNKKTDARFVGIAGAITHNLCQLAVAYMFFGAAILYYTPNLVLFALPTGLITGTVVQKSRTAIGDFMYWGGSHGP
ncbi:Gx transporter family protein [Pelotomaculum propionicicum]|uniref:Gx transporter family protein n=1 Tax=Pelotomaculum propionicicum TaxID=258475 RepID=UPI003B764AEE